MKVDLNLMIRKFIITVEGVHSQELGFFQSFTVLCMNAIKARHFILTLPELEGKDAVIDDLQEQDLQLTHSHHQETIVVVERTGKSFFTFVKD